MPRYYKYGFQGPQYAGTWGNQVSMPPTQAPGLRYGLGDEAGDFLDQFNSPFTKVPPDVSNLSDKELAILTKFTRDALVAGSQTEEIQEAGELQLATLKNEKSKRTRNMFIFLGAAGLGVYLFTKGK